MATKPSVSTEWATSITTDGASGNVNKDEPTQAFKDFGQPEALPVDRQSLNYVLNALDQWRAYFETTTDELSVSATTAIKGLVRLATDSEAEVGTSELLSISPSTLKHVLSTVGLGVVDSGLEVVALNSAKTTGIFSYLATDTNNPFSSYQGGVIVLRSLGSTYVTQIAHPAHTVRQFIRRSSNNGLTWSAWSEQFTTSNLLQATETTKGIAQLADESEARDATDDSKIMTPALVATSYKTWGLGATKARNTTDWNSAIENGFWQSNSTVGHINIPEPSAGWQGIVSSLNTENIRQLVWKSGNANYDMYMRYGNGTPLTWSPWIRMVTADNIASYIPNQVTWTKRSTAALPLNTKNILDLDTLQEFTLPPLSSVTEVEDFITLRPAVSSLAPASFKYTITADGTDQIRTRDLDKNVVTDTALEVDFITELTFIKVNGAWEY